MKNLVLISSFTLGFASGFIYLFYNKYLGMISLLLSIILIEIRNLMEN